MPIFPEGFFYTPDFLNIQEEQSLLEAIQSIELHTLIFQGFKAKRRVASFGYDYNFDKRSISKGEDIPKQFDTLIKKVADYFSRSPDEFAEILVTEYPAGSVINWHRDAPPFDMIVGISLMADCIFRLVLTARQNKEELLFLSHPLALRSLYFLKGESRSDWVRYHPKYKDY